MTIHFSDYTGATKAVRSAGGRLLASSNDNPANGLSLAPKMAYAMPDGSGIVVLWNNDKGSLKLFDTAEAAKAVALYH